MPFELWWAASGCVPGMGHLSLCHDLSGICGNSSKAMGSSGQGGGQVAFVKDHSGCSNGGEGPGLLPGLRER